MKRVPQLSLSLSLSLSHPFPRAGALPESSEFALSINAMTQALFEFSPPSSLLQSVTHAADGVPILPLLFLTFKRLARRRALTSWRRPRPRRRRLKTLLDKLVPRFTVGE